jgi:hypothetical protein
MNADKTRMEYKTNPCGGKDEALQNEADSATC